MKKDQQRIQHSKFWQSITACKFSKNFNANAVMQLIYTEMFSKYSAKHRLRTFPTLCMHPQSYPQKHTEERRYLTIWYFIISYYMYTSIYTLQLFTRMAHWPLYTRVLMLQWKFYNLSLINRA